jgi:hypothetical protein
LRKWAILGRATTMDEQCAEKCIQKTVRRQKIDVSWFWLEIPDVEF